MKIEDEEDKRKVNRVLWGLSGLSYEQERSCAMPSLILNSRWRC